MKHALFSIFASALLFTLSPVALAAGANDDIKNICNQGQNGTSEFCQGYSEGGATGDTDNPVIKVIRAVINILLYVAGVLSVIFVMFGGFKYITSAGDPQKAASGRQTLLYALVGLVVVAMAIPIVSFAFTSLTQ